MGGFSVGSAYSARNAKRLVSLTVLISVLFFSAFPGNAAGAQCPDIIPKPQDFSCTDKKFSIDSSWKITYDQNLKYIENTIDILNKTIVEDLGLYLEFKDRDSFISDYTNISNHESSNIFLLLYDDPLVKDYFESENSQIFNMSLRVGNRGFNQGYLLFTCGGSIYVLANSSQGVYYGMQSLRQIIGSQQNSISEFNMSDWPDIEYRIYYSIGHEDSTNIGDPTIGLQYLEKMARYKMNGVHLSSGSMLQHMSNMFIPCVNFSLRNFIRPILGQSMPKDIERGTEGFFVENESFTFNADDIAIPDNPGTDVLLNLDFENGNTGEVPENWYTSGNSPANGQWLLTNQEHYSGSKALMLSRDSSSGVSQPMIYQVGDIIPNSYYLARFKVKTKGSSGTGHYQFLLYFLDANNNHLFYREYDYKPVDDGNWHTFYIHISKHPEAGKLKLWIRPRGIYGTIYVDDIELIRMNAKLANVLLQDEHLFRITDTSGSVEYIKDKDYSIFKTGPDLTSKSYIKKFTNNITISRILTGNIGKNENVLISFDYLFYQDKSTPNNDNPFVDYNYDLVEQYLSNLATKFNAHGFSSDEFDVFLGQDEIRGFNMDSRSIQAGKENYEAMAIHFNKLYNLAKDSFPNSRVFFWADMLNYYHNGGSEDYQMWWGGKSGATYQASYLINKSVIMIPWWYRNSDSKKVMRESGNFFNNMGIKIAGGAGGNLDNIRYWSAILGQNSKNYFYGHSIFKADYPKGEVIKYFANYSWNVYKGNILNIAKDGDFELCNGEDDDNDGSVDEGYDFSSDPNHCGGCGNACYMPNSVGSCINGKCEYEIIGEELPADLNNDGSVDVGDLVLVAADFGKKTGFDQRADTDKNNEIDIYDIVFVASRFT